MKRQPKSVNRKMGALFSFIKKYYFHLALIGCVVFVGIFVFFKIAIDKPVYVHVKVKVGQGLWWASTQRPNLWFVQAILKAKEQKDDVKKPTAQIMDITYYPYWTSGQYDVYVTLKLKVSKGSKGTFSFNRETIAVGSPIDLEFPTVQFSGTIIEMSDMPLKEQYVEKTVFFSKKYSYPWEFDEIKIGDTILNGNEIVFRITDKVKSDTNEVFLNDQGKLVPNEMESYRYIILETKMRMKKVDNQYLFAEEIVISPGRTAGFITDNISLVDYIVAKIE